MEVRRLRNASAKTDGSSELDISAKGVSAVGPESRSLRRASIRSNAARDGTTPRAGTRRTDSTSFVSLMFVSRYSNRNARPMPPASPATQAINRLSILRGREGAIVFKEGSTTEMFDVGSAPENCGSPTALRKPAQEGRVA